MGRQIPETPLALVLQATESWSAGANPGKPDPDIGGIGIIIAFVVQSTISLVVGSFVIIGAAPETIKKEIV
ncbi:hypothetical protein BCR34DRAFT_606792 [Clohesyomyces aquaticus]|uniref:Uncharacterized protein n=1 Tax=Clohesyomyces aquaticus TaxID=1231657 RepID=A0A1Y1YLJ1_9PLEO|nr:hypothetical protein BCR34DRAFT_606792 [Clohesyomyces aquaticus]